MVDRSQKQALSNQTRRAIRKQLGLLHQLGLQDLDDQVAVGSIATAAVVGSIDILEILPQDPPVGPGGIIVRGCGCCFVIADVRVSGMGNIPAPASPAPPPVLATAQTPASSPEDAGVAASAIIIIIIVIVVAVLHRMVEVVALAPQYLDGR